ncbi:protein SUPPRESSOR OF MAX2 1 [Mercurialis annua]|uniref:protein SUPPRESSOR OF MAX2 1 n=1 Tax=Mercurialis annua TaxID=3986 RepID=UPI00215E59E0|nr:protein SUPPRESSOR OF MAX2 1 [Mercurialis annua]
MRAGLNTIQQTLTPEAASVLNHSIAEATRRNHGQTTPLHVAATLLSSPTGYLRQACIKSHPNSSHPLQCRALELCFSVALERLPTAQNLSPGHDPPISNALMAALKRAQAHQRRGCPEQQQQPLLAVKVELEQLIISILDDPSVSRVMREASFSSPAVKATIEQSLSITSSSATAACGGGAGVGGGVSNSGSFGFGFRTNTSLVPGPLTGPGTNRSMYVNPRLQQGGGPSGPQFGQQRNEEVKRVVDILLKNKKRNPVLVGESEPEMVVKELLKRIENKEIGDGLLKDVHVIHLEKEFLDKSQMSTKITELGGVIESKIGNSDCGGVILNLGDLKWLVEQPVSFSGTGGGGQPQQQIVSEAGRAAVAEMGKVLGKFEERSCGRVWLIGTATCETYLRCQVYHPSMENDWDLQAVPIAPRAPLPGMFPRLGSNGILGISGESLSSLKGFPTITPVPLRRFAENLDPVRKTSCCPQCMQNYEQELSKVSKESERSSSELKSEATQPTLPQWLKDAKSQEDDNKTSDQTATKDHELMLNQKTVELQKKWYDTCLRLHPGYHQHNIGSERIMQQPLSTTSLYNPSLLARQPFQPKLGLNRILGETPLLNPKLNSKIGGIPQLNMKTGGTPQLNSVAGETTRLPSQSPGQAASPPGSPVRTDLVLGQSKSKENTPERAKEDRTEDFLGRVASEPQTKLTESQAIKLLSSLDADSFKRLLKGLLEKVWWQREAASAVATTVTQCKLGSGRQRGNSSKGDIWLLFTGPDRVGKKKMASALSDLVCGTNPIMVPLGSRRDDGESNVNFRGKTALDRIVEAVRRNPFSVIMLDDIDEADVLVRGSIKRAMDRGRLSDSHGREISLGNVIFILTANWLPDNMKFLSSGASLDNTNLAGLVSGGWQLRLSLCEKTAKRRASWLPCEARPAKPRKDTGSGLSFDLNEAADDAEEDKADGSRNSSDLTIDHEDEHVFNNRQLTPAATSGSSELIKSVDDSIIFKPVDLASLRSEISKSITKKFSTIIGQESSFEIQDDALDKIAGGLWLSRGSLEEWTEKALVPSIRQLKLHLRTVGEGSTIIRLEPDSDSGSRSDEEWLPSSVRVVVDGL